jgi:hypothetical protein
VGDNDTIVIRADVSPEDCAFIAASRTDVPDLLDEVERLRALVQDMRGYIDGATPAEQLAPYEELFTRAKEALGE